jgi:hypothetical protein
MQTWHTDLGEHQLQCAIYCFYLKGLPMDVKDVIFELCEVW